MKDTTKTYLCMAVLVVMGMACIAGGAYILYAPDTVFNAIVGVSSVIFGAYLIRPVIRK